ncbi:MAG: hypothetical protein FOGNACKC_02867 [Anaerolineae bacterium]|nr:hypothetical protein [Anaerolineae bacterium]
MVTIILTWLFGHGDPIKATSRIAVTGASLVILSAGVLGYTALFDLFNSIGLFHPALAIFFPLLFDFAEITAAVIVLNAKLQGEDDRLAWRAVLLFTALGIIANVAHATYAYYSQVIDEGQVILAVFATALFPLSVALVTHLLKSVITRTITRAQAINTLENLLKEIDDKRSQSAQLDERIAQQHAQFTTAQQQEETVMAVKIAEIEELQSQIEHFQRRIEQLKIEYRQAEKGEFTASKAERQAYQLDGLLAAGLTLAAACEIVGVSPNTARKRLNLLNGNLLSERRHH